MAPRLTLLTLFLTLSLPPYVLGGVPPIIIGEPSPILANDVLNTTIYTLPSLNSTESTNVAKLLRRITQNDYLRILPLGASITQGVDSTTGNGYRKPLRDKLRSLGWKVNMVGTKRDGSMVDNDNEGHPGWVIAQVQGAATNIVNLGMKPNLVLINAGTNDCLGRSDPANDPATLPNRLQSLVQCVNSVNPGIRTMVKNLNNPKVILAEMNDGFIAAADMNTVDGTHPNDFGYEKMASVWFAAFSSPGFVDQISPPEDNGMPDDENTSNICPKIPGFSDGGDGSGHQTQAGSGYDDGSYRHVSLGIGNVSIQDTLGYVGGTDGGFDVTGVAFAQIINAGGAPRGGELDELVIVTAITSKNSITTRSYTYFLNEGGNPPQFSGPKSIFPPFDCDPVATRWADINNDGLDDMICIDNSANIRAAKNNGDGTFADLGTIFTAPSGFAMADVRFADIDGDGRQDYCLVYDNGDIHCWRNGGVGDAPAYWQEMSGSGTHIFPGQNKGNKTGVVLKDLNGDFRTDWLWLNTQGGVDTFINNRGTGYGLGPDWQNAGHTHAGMGVDGAEPFIRFARLFGSGRMDYVYLQPCKGNLDLYYICMGVWENQDVGGQHLKGDGVMYCDMRGTGSDDYVWVSPDGQGYFFGNQHLWDPSRWIIGSEDLFNGHIFDRRGIRLADIDGDGKCDVVLLDRNNGAMTWRKTNYDSGTGVFTFTDMGKISGPVCAEGWGGVGLLDLAVRFADIDGDNRPDYLCMEKDGRTTGFLNKGVNNWVDVGQVKKTEGWDRANIHFADANGDGSADFHWTDKFFGNTTVFYNAGEFPASGSSFTWDNAGVVWRGSAFLDRGQNFHFPNLGGLGRADMHKVDPRVNSARTWFNICPASTGGAAGDDPGCCPDPDLPVYTQSEQRFTFASMGDSWSSGVSYDGANTDYDGNAFGCLRIKTAYEPQMEADTRWTVKPNQLNWASCSGAQLVQMFDGAAAPNHPDSQASDIGSPDLLTMQIGGNNLDFGHIVEACFLQPNPLKSYGNAYPDPSGECGGAFQFTMDKILDRTTPEGFYQKYYTTLIHLFEWPAVASNPNIHIYHIGYAHFFNADTDWCNSVLFRYIPTPYSRQYLTQKIRGDFNNAIDMVHQIYKDVITQIGDPRIKFVDINPAFEGHRFCEEGHTTYQQWYHNNVWLWNLNVVANDPDNNPSQQMQDLEQLQGEDAEGNPIVISSSIDDFDSQVELTSAGLKPWMMRAFHPKAAGFSAVARMLIAQMRADNIPGIQQLITPSSSPFNQGTCHISVTQLQTCTASDRNQFLSNITVTDNSGAQIGALSGRWQTGDVHPVVMGSKIDNLISMTMDSNQELHFQVAGGATFTSNDGSCSGLVWDPVALNCDQPGDRWMRVLSCSFSCTWRGGVPTDAYW